MLAALLTSAHALATAGLLLALWRTVRSDRRTPGTPIRTAAVGLIAAGLLAIDVVVIPLGSAYRGPVQYHPDGLGAAVSGWRTAGFGLTTLAVPVCGAAAVLALLVRLTDGSARGADGWDATVARVAAGALAGSQLFVRAFTGAFPTA